MKLSKTLLTVFLLCILKLNAQDHKTYLSSHKSNFKSDSSAFFSQFDSTFYSNNIFLLGETHGYADAQTIDFELLKHLNSKLGLTNYLAEMSFSQAHFVNKYLETGDSTNLDFLFKYYYKSTMLGNSQWGNNEFYSKIQKIYAFNKGISPKIRFIGIDLPSDRRFVKAHLKEITTMSNYIIGKNLFLDSLAICLNNDSLKLAQMAHLCGKIQNDIPIHADKYQSIFKDNLPEFEYLIADVLMTNGKISRDSAFVYNLERITKLKHLENKKLYGLFGYSHINQSEINKFTPFAAKLVAKNKKVVSINILTADGEMLVKSSYLPFFLRKKGEIMTSTNYMNDNSMINKAVGINDLMDLTDKSSISLFKLDAKNSPYFNGLKLATHDTNIPGMGGGYKATKPNANTCDYFQYVFLSRNSKPLTVREVK